MQQICRSPSLLKIGRNIVNTCLPDCEVDIHVCGGLNRGYRMRLNLKREKYYWLGTYEPALQRWASRNLKGGETVLDVGANLGFTSLLFATRVGVRGNVIAVEPLPDNARRLRRHVALNRLESVIHAWEGAVSDYSGDGVFIVHQAHNMGRLATASRPPGQQSQLTVPVETIDNLVRLKSLTRVDFIKIDVEGAEAAALKGMRSTLNQFQPSLLIELHGIAEGHEVWQTLVSADYRIQRFDCARELHSPEELKPKDYILAAARRPSRSPNGTSE